MTHIALTEDEVLELRNALDRYLSIMQDEIAHTEAPPLRHALKDDIEAIQRVRRKLDAHADATDQADTWV